MGDAVNGRMGDTATGRDPPFGVGRKPRRICIAALDVSVAQAPGLSHFPPSAHARTA